MNQPSELPTTPPFTITFPNGYEVSVAFRAGNYCANRDLAGKPHHISSPSAEIVVFQAGTNRVVHVPDVGMNAVGEIGWASPADLVKIIGIVAAMPERQGAPEDVG